MQKTMIIGHIGKDAEVKEFNSNQVINFSVAVTDKWTKNGERQSKTTWYECAKWGNNTKVAQYLKKGTRAYVEGTVEADAYLSRDGDAKSTLRLKVFNVELLGGGSNSNTEPEKDKPKNAQKNDNEDEDDLPF